MVKTEGDSHILEYNPMFSSSRIYEMTGAGITTINEVSNTFQVFGLQKSGLVGGKFGGSAFCSSVIGMPGYQPLVNEE